MSDYQEYYKKAWELGLLRHSEILKDAREAGYQHAIELLKKASDGKCKCENRTDEGLNNDCNVCNYFFAYRFLEAANE